MAVREGMGEARGSYTQHSPPFQSFCYFHTSRNSHGDPLPAEAALGDRDVEDVGPCALVLARSRHDCQCCLRTPVPPGHLLSPGLRGGRILWSPDNLSGSNMLWGAEGAF